MYPYAVLFHFLPPDETVHRNEGSEVNTPPSGYGSDGKTMVTPPWYKEGIRTVHVLRGDGMRRKLSKCPTALILILLKEGASPSSHLSKLWIDFRVDAASVWASPQIDVL